MGNKRFWLGILVMVLVFGMIDVGCKARSNKGGEFTLTDIPAKYNGKYAVLYGDGADLLVGCDRIKPLKLSRIINGKVILPMWITRDGIKFERYSDNYQDVLDNRVYIHIFIMEKVNDITDLKEWPNDWIDEIYFSDYRSRSGRDTFNSVRFSNGNATRSYNDQDNN